MAKEKKPLFVNLQSGPVQVFDEARKAKSVHPWANRNRKSVGGTYIVAGEHYRQFVSKMGPLSKLPPGEKFNPTLLPEDADASDVPEAPKEVQKPAPKAPEPPKEEAPATGQTEGFPDGTAEGSGDEVESGGSAEAGADAGSEDAPKADAAPKGKVKVKGKGHR